MNRTADSTTATLTGEEAKLAREASRTLSRALQGRRSISLRLSGSENELQLPAAAAPLLIEILDQMSNGKTVEVLASDVEISLQRAANLLHVSRTFLTEFWGKKRVPSVASARIAASGWRTC